MTLSPPSKLARATSPFAWLYSISAPDLRGLDGRIRGRAGRGRAGQNGAGGAVRSLVKLADRASNVQTLRNLAPERQRYYFAQTVTYIVPLAEMDPWFAQWYAAWQQDFADLA